MALNQLVQMKAAQGRELADERANRLIGSVLGLFTNNATITRDTVIGDLTEAAWLGYARRTLNNWTAEGEIGDGIHRYVQNTDSPAFLNLSGGFVTFYGYFILDAAGNLAYATNSGLVTVPDGTAEIVVVQVTQRSEYASSP